MDITVYEGSSSELVPSLRSLFFLTATNPPEGEESRQEYLDTWLSQYLVSPTGLHIIASDEERVTGYIISEIETSKNQEMVGSHPSLSLFKEQFQEYEVHFHINIHPEYQRKGLGRLMFDSFNAELRKKEIKSVSVITGTEADNRSFYEKLGFHEYVQKDIGNSSLSFFVRKT